jgi:hypothetical protein
MPWIINTPNIRVGVGTKVVRAARMSRKSFVDGFCIAGVFCNRDGLSVQSCDRPVCVTLANGPDEFRKRGSYRRNDFWEPRHSSECPCSWLTSFRITTLDVLHLWAGSSDRLPIFHLFRQKRPDDPGGFVGSSRFAVQVLTFSGLFLAISARDVMPKNRSFRIDRSPSW